MERSGMAETARLLPFQRYVLAICFFIVLIDGLDTQAAAFAAPLLAHEFAASKALLGPVFGASLLGSLIGGLVFGPLGDRIGRKYLILAMAAIIAVGSLATAFAPSLQAVAVLRFVTGIGLGGAIPNLIAMSAEYSPLARRASLVALVFSGFPIGALLGSAISVFLLPEFGWRILFLLGGILPLIAIALVIASLPESLQFLAAAGRQQQLDALLQRFGPTATRLLDDDTRRHHLAKRGSIRQLFAPGFAAGTLLIWVTTFASLLCVYCVISWLPTLVRGAGLPLVTALLASTAINLGSIVGNLAIARAADRVSPFRLMAASYAIGALFIALIGFATGSAARMLAICFVAGLFSIGAQLCFTSVVITRFYPTVMRATGIGWSFGVGRIGGVIGPLFAGVLVESGIQFNHLMAVLGLVSLIPAAAIGALGWIQRGDALRI